MRKIIIFITVLIIFTQNIFAHPGNTDSDGCHTCRTNCEKWGLNYDEYHCHNAKGANPVNQSKSIDNDYNYNTTKNNTSNAPTVNTDVNDDTDYNILPGVLMVGAFIGGYIFGRRKK